MLLSLFAFSTAALAEEPAATPSSDARHGLSLGVGTLGGSLSYIYAANESLALSARYHFLPAPESTKDSEMIGEDIGPYQDLTTLSGASLLVHYHPFKTKMQWARVSLGAVYNMSSIDISKSGDEASVGTAGSTADLTDDPLKASVSFNSVLPSFTLGAGINNSEGFGFVFDLGVMYQGAASVSFEDNATVSDDDIAAEKSVLEDFYAGQASIYPVLQLGVSYMF